MGGRGASTDVKCNIRSLSKTSDLEYKLSVLVSTISASFLPRGTCCYDCYIACCYDLRWSAMLFEYQSGSIPVMIVYIPALVDTLGSKKSLRARNNL